MSEITAEPKSLSAMLRVQKYSIDFYQREYDWKTKHVSELILDLIEKFRNEFDANHDRGRVAQYPPYFLGDIITSKGEENKCIIDGQQRLTTLTLLLIVFRNYQKLLNLKDENIIVLDELIRSKKYGSFSYNLNIEDRNDCMNALFEENEEFEFELKSQSNSNLYTRYFEIRNIITQEITDVELPYFIDWVLERVHFVEIYTDSAEDAYSIFEHMNDRGLSLTPTDMLKGFLLSNIGCQKLRNDAKESWQELVSKLVKSGKGNASDCIKAWLRSQYADDIRDRKRNAEAKSFDLIGTGFHRWIKGNFEKIGLKSDKNFFEFISKEFEFYSNHFIDLNKASQTIDPSRKHIRFVDQLGVTFQYNLFLSPLKQDDSEELIKEKLNLTSKFLEILLVKRLWNSKSITFSAMQYAFFTIMKDIRDLSIEQISAYLYDYIKKQNFNSFENCSGFELKRGKRKIIHGILARITEYIEVQSGKNSRYEEYVNSDVNHYEIEHIWNDNYEYYQEQNRFSNVAEFNKMRNQLGGLLILPKIINASLGGSISSYPEKLIRYNTENLLASSLHSDCYKNNPRFKKFIEENQLSFKPYNKFGKKELNERQKLYCEIAELIWNPEELIL